MIRKRC